MRKLSTEVLCSETQWEFFSLVLGGCLGAKDLFECIKTATNIFNQSLKVPAKSQSQILRLDDHLKSVTKLSSEGKEEGDKYKLEKLENKKK